MEKRGPGELYEEGYFQFYLYEVRHEEGGKAVCDCWTAWHCDVGYYRDNGHSLCEVMEAGSGEGGWWEHLDSFYEGEISGPEFESGEEFVKDVEREVGSCALGFLKPWDVKQSTPVGFYWFCAA